MSSVRPEELAFNWKDLEAEKRLLWGVRAVNLGKFHTPKYHRTNRPLRLTEADVQRLLALKARMKAQDEDWMFSNRIKKGKTMKPGPIWHEGPSRQGDTACRGRAWLSAHHLASPAALGATQMVEARVPLKEAQQRLGQSRPDILLKGLRACSRCAGGLGGGNAEWAVGGGFSALNCPRRGLIWAFRLLAATAKKQLRLAALSC